MRRRDLIVALAAFLLPLPAAHAQRDEVMVARAAVQFLRDSLPRGPLVIDAEMLRAVPALAPADADRVAREVGASRGRFREIVSCTEPPPLGPCTSRDGATVVSISQPAIRNGAAEVYLYFVKPVSPTHIQGVYARFTLVRTAAGAWRVTSMRIEGVS